MTYATLRESVRKKKLDAAYFFHGDNQFLIDELVQTLTSAVLAPGFGAFDRTVLYGDEVDAAALLNALETPPMASFRRLVVLSGVHKLSEKVRAALLGYLDRPAPSSLLVVTAPKVDLKKQFYRQLNTRCTTVRLSNLKERETIQWIRDRTESLGHSMDTKAAALLQNSIGDDQSYLANEIDKLVMCVGGRKRITAEDVASVAGRSRVNSIFELSDAVANLDCYRSVALVNNLLDWGQKPTGILAFILRHMLILLGIKSLQGRKASREEICRRLNILPYFLGGYVRQASRFTTAGLRDRIRLIQRTDGRLKSSGSSKSLELESLMYALCRKDACGDG